MKDVDEAFCEAVHEVTGRCPVCPEFLLRFRKSWKRPKGNNDMDKIDFNEFSTVESVLRPDMMIAVTPEPEDPPGTMAVPIIVRHPAGHYVVAKMRLWLDSRRYDDEPLFGPLVTDDEFASVDDAGAWVRKHLDKAEGRS